MTECSKVIFESGFEFCRHVLPMKALQKVATIKRSGRVGTFRWSVQKTYILAINVDHAVYFGSSSTACESDDHDSN